MSFRQQTRRTVKMKKYLTEANLSRVMKLRGLPFTITPEQLCDFFQDFNVSKSDVVIEEVNGKKTGFGLVFFADEATAQRARMERHKKSIGQRYVEVLECGFQDIVQ
jgi:RNA recognition motif-containing protein